MVRRPSLAALAAALLLPSTALAQTVPAAPRDRVLDQAGALSADDRADLQRTIWALERDTGAEVGVLVARTSGGASTEGYARRVFDRWGIGKRGRDNGVLVLLLIEDRQAWIEPGRGYAHRLDPGGILDREMVPLLKEGRPGAAVCAAVRGVAAAVRRVEGAAAEPAPGAPEAPLGFGGAHAPRPAAPHHPDRTSAPLPEQPAAEPIPFRPTPAHRSSWTFKDILPWAVGVPALVVLAYLLRPKCPRCATYLNVHSRTLVSATYTSSGRGERTLDCPKCSYHRVEVYTISRKQRSTTKSSSSSPRSGGSSFGGGRSSGAGAGRSW